MESVSLLCGVHGQVTKIRVSSDVLNLFCHLFYFSTDRNRSTQVPVGCPSGNSSASSLLLLPVGYCMYFLSVQMWEYKENIKNINDTSPETKFMGPTLGQTGSYRPHMGPMLAPWTLLSGYVSAVKVAAATALAMMMIMMAMLSVLIVMKEMKGT